MLLELRGVKNELIFLVVYANIMVILILDEPDAKIDFKFLYYDQVFKAVFLLL